MLPRCILYSGRSKRWIGPNPIPWIARLAVAVALVSSPIVSANDYGFANRAGGSPDDPVIEIAASVFAAVPQFAGGEFSYLESEQAYGYVPGNASFQSTAPMPVIPSTTMLGNQFIRIAFPFDLRASAAQSLATPIPGLASNSYLTANLSITDENGVHVPGIVTIDGDDVFGTNLTAFPSFPLWTDSAGSNQLLGRNVLTYIADDGDQVLGSNAVFGATSANPSVSAIKEIHIRLREIDGVIVNGHWVLKIGLGHSQPVAGQPALSVASIDALDPVVPPTFQGGDLVVEPESRYLLRFSEPVVPLSVGFSAAYVEQYNASLPSIPLAYNGNVGTTPNPLSVSHPYYPNFRLSADPGGAPYSVPFDVRPINPNNFSEYVVRPLIDLPSGLKTTLTSIAESDNVQTVGPNLTQSSAATTPYNVVLDTPAASSSESFFSGSGVQLVNAPVAPQVVYFTSEDGGVGGVNLDGNGFETNDPATARVQILTSNVIMCQCPTSPLIAGSHLLGCNANAFGDPSGVSPVGIAGNPFGTHLGPPTPFPGVNEGSSGTTATDGLLTFPQGFETLIRDAAGDANLASFIGEAADIQVGDFLDKRYFDSANPGAAPSLHQSFVVPGVPLPSNSISDPPVPNPPPLRLPVGLSPIDVAAPTDSSAAVVIEGEEVFPAGVGCGGAPEALVQLFPNPFNPISGDIFPPLPQNGPSGQEFASASAYSARQQIGNYLYVANPKAGVVEVLNSNRFTRIGQIDLPDPTGLAISPDLKRLYVTNERNHSVSVVDVDPLSANFNEKIVDIPVGRGPRAIAVQPDNEDVFVCNYRGDSVSIISVQTLTVRKTLTVGIDGPWEVVVSPRHVASGFASQVYFAFIASRDNGRVLVYESGPGSVGADDIRWEVLTPSPLIELRGMVYDPGTYPGSSTALPGGCYITHVERVTGEPLVSRIAWTQQSPSAGPLLPGTPGLDRRFTIVSQWGGIAAPLNRGGASRIPHDIALADFRASAFFSLTSSEVKTNLGADPSVPSIGAGQTNSKFVHRVNLNGDLVPTWRPDRMYVSFPEDGVIEVLDTEAGGGRLNTIRGVPRGAKLATYFDG